MLHDNARPEAVDVFSSSCQGYRVTSLEVSGVDPPGHDLESKGWADHHSQIIKFRGINTWIFQLKFRYNPSTAFSIWIQSIPRTEISIVLLDTSLFPTSAKMLRVSAMFMACLLLATAAPTAPEKSNVCLSMCLQEKPACASDEVSYSIFSFHDAQLLTPFQHPTGSEVYLVCP